MKNIIILLAVILLVEYTNGTKRNIISQEKINIIYPTTVIKIGRGHKKYIDMRRVKNIYQIGNIKRVK